MTGARWRRLGIALVAAVSVLGVGTAATAADSSGNFFSVGIGVAGRNVLSEQDMSAAVSGDLVVSFHGDTATGCAAEGLCAYSGIVIVHPGSSAQLSIAKVRTRKGVSYQGALFFDSFSTGSYAHVRRTIGTTDAGDCVDQQTNGGLGATDALARRGVISVGLIESGGTSLTTRCAGPLDGDVASAVPRLTVSLKRLLGRGGRFDLGGARPFAGHGFAGTVRSTIVLRFHKPSRGGSPGGSGPPPPTKKKRIRFVTEELQVVRLAGRLSEDIRGVRDSSECVLVDSCGLSGTLGGALAPRHAEAYLFATGSARRPLRDFRAALGLGRSGDPRGIGVYGSTSWRGGSFAENTSQSGICTDTGPLEGGVIFLRKDKAGFSATYAPSGPLRTRCPGPVSGGQIGDGNSFGPAGFASAQISTHELGRRTLVIQLRATKGFTDTGYSIESHSSLSVTLRRGRVTQQVIVQPY